MSTGKPWDDPDSDPAGDIEEYVRAEGEREWLPADDGRITTGVRDLTEAQWTELQGAGRVEVGDGTLLDMGGGRVFFAPAGTPAPNDWGYNPGQPLPPAPLGTTVETRLFGMPYRWVRTRAGQLRLQRIGTPPMYRELVRAHLDLAGGNPAFREVGGG